MNIHDQSRADFGRRGRDVHAPVARDSASARPARESGRDIGRDIGVWVLTGLLLATAGALIWSLQIVAKQYAETTHAEQRVIEIINQPVTHLPRSGNPGVFSPGWFHPGALKPDFNTVDVRTTQEFPYEGYAYVTSDVTPDEMFVGDELEFNAMTKYFYTDRGLPKKRLSDAEMSEINSLYRVLGRNEEASTVRWLTVAGLVAVAFGLGLALLLLVRRPHDETNSGSRA